MRLLDPLYWTERKNEARKKGGGGGVDTSGLEEATKQATQLQRDIYEQTRQDVQPWYNMGGGAVSKLSDLLGISGGAVQSRDSIYNELLPQFTSSQTTGVQGNQYIAPDGRVIDLSNMDQFYNQNPNVAYDRDLYGRAAGAFSQGNLGAVEQMGFTPMSTQTTQDTVDYDALNAAVNERMSGQGVPENYGSLLERFGLDKFQEDPSYQFRQDEARKALERGMSAQGVTLGGGGYGEINPQVARALNEQTQNLASMEYNNAYNRYVQDQLNTYNMLMGAAGMGQGSTGILATGGQNYANNVGNLQTGLASAQMNAQLAQASQPSMFEQILPVAGQVASAYFMSDRRIKNSIERIGEENGYPIYKFKYNGNPKTYIGVMADDVKKVNPKAVVKMYNGFDAVNYDAIGVQMREV